MNRFIPLLLALGVVMSVAAEQPPTRPPGPPPRIDFARELNLSPERGRQLEAILQNEQEQHRAARERARAEIAKLLSPDEMSKFESLMPRPRGPMGPPPERR
jgi:hypothetical protein